MVKGGSGIDEARTSFPKAPSLSPVWSLAVIMGTFHSCCFRLCRREDSYPGAPCFYQLLGARVHGARVHGET